MVTKELIRGSACYGGATRMQWKEEKKTGSGLPLQQVRALIAKGHSNSLVLVRQRLWAAWYMLIHITSSGAASNMVCANPHDMANSAGIPPGSGPAANN
eukprot:559300-Amphidinium_carterae.1